MKIIAIGGEPAVGKSTLVTTLMGQLAKNEFMLKPSQFKMGLVRGHTFSKSRLYVLGIYEGGKFDGTDRLSMSVQRDAEAFIEHVADKYPDWTVLFEGDRLFNRKFLDFCHKRIGSGLSVMVLHASQNTKRSRHEGRGDTQTEVFLRGRATKIRNIIQSAVQRISGFEIVLREHTLPEHTDGIIHDLIGLVCPQPFVIVTREQATEALLQRAELPFHHLARRFKEEYHLDFKVTDFSNKSLFKFDYAGDTEENAKAFRVVYIGGQ